MKFKEYLTEASPINFEELDKDKQKFVISMVGKNNINSQGYHSGIHGEIISFKSIYGDRIRIDKKDLKKIMNNKDIRWIDIAAIGF